MIVKSTFGLLMALALVHAGDVAQSPPSKVASVSSEGWYVGAALSRMQLGNADFTETLQAAGGSLVVGYRLNDFVALEGRYSRSTHLRYTHQGKSKNLSTSCTNTALYAKLSYPIQRLSPYLLLGYGQNTLSSLSSSPRHERSLQYGAGLEYRIGDHWQFFGDYVRTYKGTGFDGRAKQSTITAHLLSAGLIYQF